MKKTEWILHWETKNKHYAKIFDKEEEARKKAKIQHEKGSKEIRLYKQEDESDEETLRISILETHYLYK